MSVERMGKEKKRKREASVSSGDGTQRSPKKIKLETPVDDADLDVWLVEKPTSIGWNEIVKAGINFPDSETPSTSIVCDGSELKCRFLLNRAKRCRLMLASGGHDNSDIVLTRRMRGALRLSEEDGSASAERRGAVEPIEPLRPSVNPPPAVDVRQRVFVFGATVQRPPPIFRQTPKKTKRKSKARQANNIAKSELGHSLDDASSSAAQMVTIGESPKRKKKKIKKEKHELSE